MIGHLRGRIAAKHPPQLVVDVGGVGYEVEAPMSTFYSLPAIGTEVSLHTHLVVREDAHVLFGFGTERERSLFRELIKVSGPASLLRSSRASRWTSSIAASKHRTMPRSCACRGSAARSRSGS